MKFFIRNILFVFIYLILFVFSVNAAEPLSFQSNEQGTTVIEAFVSQGCSSCPPAEKWLNQFINSPQLWKEIIPVAFHVDYWDYLGWKDPFATKSNTQRQYQYKKIGKVGSVYTPGFVVNGKEWREWFSRGRLPSSNEKKGILSAKLSERRLEVSYAQGKEGLELHVVILGFGLKTDVTRGENRGRLLESEFVALAHQKYLSSEGRWSVDLSDISVVEAEKYGIAVWVSYPNDPVPLQAAGSLLPEKYF